MSSFLANYSKNKSNRNTMRSFSLIAAALMLVGVALLNMPNAGAGASDFSFGAVGDHGADGPDSQGDATSTVFKSVGGKNISFLQSLGDLAYNPSDAVSSANDWCLWAENNMDLNNGGSQIPLVLLSGNHEAQDAVSGFAIEDYASGSACANPFEAQTAYYGNSSSNYAKDFYFDYPATNPIARFININPGEDYQNDGVHDYSQASNTYYKWVSDSIDSAKASNKWVIVSYHMPFINENSDKHGSDLTTTLPQYRTQFIDLFNLLASKKVDLVLNGHDHNYQRSKQISLGTNCSAIEYNSYIADCVKHEGTSADPYVKGDGLVQVISGMGGHTPDTINNTTDPDYNYTVTRANGTEYGFMKFDVTNTSITGTYVNASGGSYADTFTISAPTQPTGDSTKPTVSFTAPTSNETISTPTYTLAATASDDSGTVTKVEFYIGAQKLGEAVSAPYTFNWDTTGHSNSAVTLTAKAYDASGNAETADVNVTVGSGGGTPTEGTPTVSLTSPTAGAALSGTTILTATASDNGSITKVEFYAGTVKLGEDTTSPYDFDWNTASVSNGDYNITAKAYDNEGNVTTSASVAVTVSNTGGSSVDFSTKASTDPEVVSKAVMSITDGACNHFTSSTTLPATGITVAEKNVTVLGGFDFTIGCATSGGTATVEISLGARYPDVSKVRVYKNDVAVTSDITSKVTLKNTTNSTVITYTLTDGNDFDADKAVNAIIDDPLYVGLLGATTTTPPQSGGGAGADVEGTPAQAGSGGSLADTGQKLGLIATTTSALLLVSVGVFYKKPRAKFKNNR